MKLEFFYRNIKFLLLIMKKIILFYLWNLRIDKKLSNNWNNNWNKDGREYYYLLLMFYFKNWVIVM